MASSPLTIILQLISEEYMVELHSPPGRYTIILYLADYVNTLNPIWFTLDNNTNPSGFSHIYTRKVLLPHIIHYHHDPTYSSLCIKTFTWLRFMIYTHSLDYAITSEHTERDSCTDWAIRDACSRGRLQYFLWTTHEITMATYITPRRPHWHQQ